MTTTAAARLPCRRVLRPAVTRVPRRPLRDPGRRPGNAAPSSSPRRSATTSLPATTPSRRVPRSGQLLRGGGPGPAGPDHPTGPADPARRRPQAPALHGQPGRARARPAPQARRPRVQHEAGHRHGPRNRGHDRPPPRRRRGADGVRPGRSAGLPAAGQHRVLPDGCARTGLRPAQALVRLPGRARLGAARAGGPGRDRHQHGRLPQATCATWWTPRPPARATT